MSGRDRKLPRRIVLAVTARQSLGLLRGFPEYMYSRGWEVHVVSNGLPDDLSLGVRHHAIPMERNPNPARDLVSLFLWIRLLWRVRPTVISSGTPKAGLLGIMAAFVLRVPVRIYKLRGLRLHSERGGKRVLLASLERLTAWSSTGILSVSPSLAREFVLLGLAPEYKVMCLGPGSSNGVVVPRSADRLVRKVGVTVGFIGRLHPDKGVDYLLEAAQQLRSDGLDVKLLLLGREEQNWSLSKYFHDHGGAVPEWIRWEGYVEKPDQYFKHMDILCLPTKREGFPNVILESAVHAVPSVASRVTGCVDAVIEGSTGLLYEPGSTHELKDALRTLVLDVELRESMGSAAREWVSENFERQLVWSRYEKFYEDQLLRADKGRRGSHHV